MTALRQRIKSTYNAEPVYSAERQDSIPESIMGESDYIKSILNPFTSKAPSLPDDNTTPCIRKQLKLDESLAMSDITLLASAPDFIIVFRPNAPTRNTTIWVRKQVSAVHYKYVYLKEVPFDQVLSDNFSLVRPVNGGVMVICSTTSTTTTALNGHINAAILATVPDVADLSESTIRSLAVTERDSCQALVSEGVSVIPYPTGTKPFRPDNTNAVCQFTAGVITQLTITLAAAVLDAAYFTYPSMYEVLLAVPHAQTSGTAPVTQFGTFRIHARCDVAPSAGNRYRISFYRYVATSAAVAAPVLIHEVLEGINLPLNQVYTAFFNFDYIEIAEVNGGGALQTPAVDAPINVEYLSPDYYDPSTHGVCGVMAVTGVGQEQIIKIDGVSNYECVPDQDLVQNVKPDFGKSDQTAMRLSEDVIAHLDTFDLAMAMNLQSYQRSLLKISHMASSKPKLAGFLAARGRLSRGIAGLTKAGTDALIDMASDATSRLAGRAIETGFGIPRFFSERKGVYEAARIRSRRTVDIQDQEVTGSRTLVPPEGSNTLFGPGGMVLVNYFPIVERIQEGGVNTLTGIVTNHPTNSAKINYYKTVYTSDNKYALTYPKNFKVTDDVGTTEVDITPQIIDYMLRSIDEDIYIYIPDVCEGNLSGDSCWGAFTVTTAGVNGAIVSACSLSIPSDKQTEMALNVERAVYAQVAPESAKNKIELMKAMMAQNPGLMAFMSADAGLNLYTPGLKAGPFLTTSILDIVVASNCCDYIRSTTETTQAPEPRASTIDTISRPPVPKTAAAGPISQDTRERILARISSLTLDTDIGAMSSLTPATFEKAQSKWLRAAATKEGADLYSFLLSLGINPINYGVKRVVSVSLLGPQPEVPPWMLEGVQRVVSLPPPPNNVPYFLQAYYRHESATTKQKKATALAQLKNLSSVTLDFLLKGGTLKTVRIVKGDGDIAPPPPEADVQSEMDEAEDAWQDNA